MESREEEIRHCNSAKPIWQSLHGVFWHCPLLIRFLVVLLQNNCQFSLPVCWCWQSHNHLCLPLYLYPYPYLYLYLYLCLPLYLLHQMFGIGFISFLLTIHLYPSWYSVLASNNLPGSIWSLGSPQSAFPNRTESGILFFCWNFHRQYFSLLSPSVQVSLVINIERTFIYEDDFKLFCCFLQMVRKELLDLIKN